MTSLFEVPPTAPKPSRQNTSHAVMNQRTEPKESLDFFPTPPFATRALCEYGLKPHCPDLHRLTAWEPACGTGAMAKPLGEYFGDVRASDIHPYGYGEVRDFLAASRGAPVHWIITNPPFNLAQRFAEEAIERATVGVALLVRTNFLEGQARHAFFQRHRPARICQFAERVAMVKGRLDRKASTATSYCWVVWQGTAERTEFEWIPPCRAALDRDEDWPE